MKALAFSVLALAVVVAVLSVADSAEATTVCHATNNWCQGYSHVSTTTGGVASARCFALRTTNTAPSCTFASGITPSNEAVWQLDAGTCLTFYYFETTGGASPPLAPNKVAISVALESGGTNLRVYKDGTGPPDASGTSYQFCATNDGTTTGSPRAGTVRMFIRAIKDNGVGGVGNYNINSDGGGSPLSFDKGMLRAAMLVQSIGRNAYPAGSTFAYGAAGDESITITSTFTEPFGDIGVERLLSFIVDEATFGIGAGGASVDVDGGSLVQVFVVDQTFPSTSSPYIAGLEVTGNSGVTGLKWTLMATTGHCATCVRLTDIVVYDSGDFGIDPDVSFDQDGVGPPDNLAAINTGSCSGSAITLANRGETVCGAWYLLNARGEQLTRAMTHATEDASNVVCTNHGSLSPTAGLYSVTWAIPTGGSCLAANTALGSARHFRATNTDQIEVSADAFSVSSLYFVDAHLQVASTLVQDDFPTEDADEDFLFQIRSSGGVDDSDVVHLWCHVVNVRQDTDIDTSGSAISRELRDPTATVRASGATDTGSDGWTGVLSLLSSTPLGAWEGECDASFNGNTGTDTEPFTIDVEGGGGGEIVYTGADPLTIFADQPENGTVWFAVHSRTLNGAARIGFEDEIFVSAFELPGMTPVVSLAAVEEVDPVLAPGAYAYAFDYPDEGGSFLIVANTTDGATAIGAHNIITISNATADQVLAQVVAHRKGSIEVDMNSDFYGMGFDGFAFFVFWFVMLLLFVFKWELEWCAAFTVPAILIFVVPIPEIGGYDWDMAFSVICIIFGVLLQFFKEKRDAKNNPSVNQ